MNYYAIAKFVHIVGALGIFAALGVEWLSLMNLRRATNTAQLHEWIRISSGIRRLGGVSMVSILLSGFYMMAVGHIGAAWLVVAFWALILLSLLAVAVTGRRIAAIRQAIHADIESISPSLHQLLHQPLLWIVTQIRVGLALGIVFLMTVKPGLIVSLLTIGIAILLGLASALPALKHEPNHTEAKQGGPKFHNA